VAVSTELLVNTVLALGILAVFIWLTRTLLRRRFHRLEGHERILAVFTGLMGAVVGVYVATLWGLASLVVGSIAAAGSLAIIVGFALVPYLSDAFVGLALHLDAHIQVGADVEIAGKRGRIIELSLTRTKIAGDECLYLVPNRKFREEIVTLWARRSAPKDGAAADLR
jgi:small-conductance mechanosensitive channel